MLLANNCLPVILRWTSPLFDSRMPKKIMLIIPSSKISSLVSHPQWQIHKTRLDTTSFVLGCKLVQLNHCDGVYSNY